MTPLIGKTLSQAACEHLGIDLTKFGVTTVMLSLPHNDAVKLHVEVMVSADDLAKIAEIARGKACPA